jgi:ribonucleoside-diphosphate reductase alpha chain
MTTQSLAAYKFAASYGRFLPELNRREIPSESFERVIEMHRTKYKGVDIEAELSFCLEAMKDGLVLGSQRALQFGGSPILRKEARAFNCSGSYADRPRFFQECLYLLLCGCGTGFSVQRHHVARLPKLIAVDKHQIKVFTVADSVEGWADALGVLLASYGCLGSGMNEFAEETAPGDDSKVSFQHPGCFADYVGSHVSFDYSRIRNQGSSLSTGAGKAPGPGPLSASLEKIRGVLDTALTRCHGEDCHLRPIDVYDIIMHASDAVLAGGVRRSATICLFSVDDPEMMNAKTGNWMQDNPQRARSNNSAMLIRGETTWEAFHDIFMLARRQYGEPGFVWSDSPELMVNPCVETGMYPAISFKDLYEMNGVPSAEGGDCPVQRISEYSGWAFCNLCEVNAKACRTDKDWGRACTAAAILGTLQAGYTKFDYLGNVSECIAKREALLGVSMTGMMDNPSQSFDPKRQRDLAKLILDVNAALAPRLGIRPTARATCVKPAGSTSCLLGTSSGIHAQHAKRYFRRAQANVNEAPFQYFKVHNPDAVERSVWEPNGNTAVITFCIEASDEALTRREVNGLKQLEYVKLTQDNWVAAGSVPERAVKPWLHHNVSNTITIRQNQEEDAARYIYDHRESFTGVSILGTSGDLDYPQAPFCEVRTESEILERYGRGAFFASGLIVDGLHAFGNNLWLACDTVMGLGEASVLANGVPYPADPNTLPDAIREAYEHVHALKKDWIRRARKFAENYFGFDSEKEVALKKKLNVDSSVPRAGRSVPKSTSLSNHYDALHDLYAQRDALRQMTYCLKEVNNLHLWERLTRGWSEVDYSLMVEEHDGTKGAQPEMACAGGACTLQHA